MAAEIPLRDATRAGDTGAEDPDRLLAEAYERLVTRTAGHPLSLRDWVEVAERWRILCALRECRGNRSEAARRLGIGRRTLYSKMERLRIGAPAGEESAGTHGRLGAS